MSLWLSLPVSLPHVGKRIHFAFRRSPLRPSRESILYRNPFYLLLPWPDRRIAALKDGSIPWAPSLKYRPSLWLSSCVRLLDCVTGNHSDSKDGHVSTGLTFTKPLVGVQHQVLFGRFQFLHQPLILGSDFSDSLLPML